MKTSHRLVIGLLALTTVGGAMLAWRQYGELVELRAAAMNRDERSDHLRRIADLERLVRDLQDQLAAERGSDDLDGLVADTDVEEPGAERSSRDRGRGDSRGRDSDRGRQQAAALRELMAKPEVQAIIALQQKGAIEARYAALFRNLNLTPEQTEKLKTLLADRTNTRRDVEAAARAQGIDPRENPDAYRKLLAAARDDLDASIKATIGETGFAQLQNFEQTMPQRNLVDSLQQRLSHTMPLTATQADQLVQILAQNAPQRTSTSTATPGSGTTPSGGPNLVVRGPGFSGPSDFGRGGPDFGRSGFGGFSAPVTPGAVAQAQTILAPPQVAALQQIQQQQQAQQQLQQLVRDTLRASAPTQPGTPATGTPGAAPSGRKRGG